MYRPLDAPRLQLQLAKTTGARRGAALAATARSPGMEQRVANLELVAEFEHQVTGVSVAEDGRIFVNFPRWSEDTAVSVAELMPDDALRPYPDEEWNAW